MSDPELVHRLVLILPLLAGILYALAALALNAAIAEGVTPARASALANAVTAVAFLIFVPWGEPLLQPGLLKCVLGLGFSFWLGQVFTAWSLGRGEVSIATPVLSSKVVLVAFLLATVLREPLEPEVWWAGLLTCAGIACLNLTDAKPDLRALGATVAYALLAALSFAAFDVMVQGWSKMYGFGRVVPGGIIVAALLSAPMLPPKARLRPAGPHRKRYLAMAVGLLALQAVIFVSTIGLFGQAAAANVVYGSRGLSSLIVVKLLGEQFGRTEQHMSLYTFRARAIGAVLILVAIGLVVFR